MKEKRKMKSAAATPRLVVKRAARTTYPKTIEKQEVFNLHVAESEGGVSRPRRARRTPPPPEVVVPAPKKPTLKKTTSTPSAAIFTTASPKKASKRAKPRTLY